MSKRRSSHFVVSVICFTALLLLTDICLAQKQTAHPSANLRWNWHKAQYLTAHDEIGRLKSISNQDRRRLLEAIAKEFDEPEPMVQAKKVRARLVDLNHDGTAEVFLQPGDSSMCSPTGNCPLWIFRKTADGYRLLFETDGIQNFTVQPTQHSGYSDLVLGTHSSASEEELSLYRYREGRYESVGCFVADWQHLGNDGEYRALKVPEITTCEAHAQAFSSCSMSIPTMTDEANVIVIARVKAIGPQPGEAAGALPAKQRVTYALERILKGELAVQELSADYAITTSSRLCNSDGTKLNPALFQIGKRVIAFLRVYTEHSARAEQSLVVDTLEDDCDVLKATAANVKQVKQALPLHEGSGTLSPPPRR